MRKLQKCIQKIDRELRRSKRVIFIFVIILDLDKFMRTPDLSEINEKSKLGRNAKMFEKAFFQNMEKNVFLASHHIYWCLWATWEEEISFWEVRTWLPSVLRFVSLQNVTNSYACMLSSETFFKEIYEICWLHFLKSRIFRRA